MVSEDQHQPTEQQTTTMKKVNQSNDILHAPALRIPFLSEVTITATTVPARSKSSSEQALDLSKNNNNALTKLYQDGDQVQINDHSKTDSKSNQNYPLYLPPMMNPIDFQRANMPKGFVFCPGPESLCPPKCLKS